jgi:hypothetical protein
MKIDGIVGGGSICHVVFLEIINALMNLTTHDPTEL